MKSGYMSKFTPFAETTRCRDINLWKKYLLTKVLPDLLPKQRNRILKNHGHYFTLPRVNTKRYKKYFCK